MDYADLLALLIGFGGYSVAEAVLSYLPEELKESCDPRALSLGVGVLSAGAAYTASELLPPAITAFAVSLVTSCILLAVIEEVGTRWSPRHR